MRSGVPATSGSRRNAGPAKPDTGREVQLPLDREELLGLMQDSLEGLAVELGLLVASALLEDEVTRLCGARYERRPERAHTRYGRQGGVVTLGGQKLPVARPRVRRADGGGEVRAGDLRQAPVAASHAAGRAPPHGAWREHS